LPLLLLPLLGCCCCRCCCCRFGLPLHVPIPESWLERPSKAAAQHHRASSASREFLTGILQSLLLAGMCCCMHACAHMDLLASHLSAVTATKITSVLVCGFLARHTGILGVVTRHPASTVAKHDCQPLDEASRVTYDALRVFGTLLLFQVMCICVRTGWRADLLVLQGIEPNPGPCGMSGEVTAGVGSLCWSLHVVWRVDVCCSECYPTTHFIMCITSIATGCAHPSIAPLLHNATAESHTATAVLHSKYSHHCAVALQSMRIYSTASAEIRLE
jgi:hypothetical protein